MSKTKEEKKQETRYYCLYNQEARDELLGWWRALDDAGGGRAQLKRCTSPDEAVLHPLTHRLSHLLPWVSLEAVATIAGLLSHVKTGENDSMPIGRKLARSIEPGGAAPFSESRFRQLLVSRDWNEFYRNLRRAIDMLGGNVNPLLVADMILCWDKEKRGEDRAAPGKTLKFRLSKDYYTEADKNKSDKK